MCHFLNLPHLSLQGLVSVISGQAFLYLISEPSPKQPDQSLQDWSQVSNLYCNIFPLQSSCFLDLIKLTDLVQGRQQSVHSVQVGQFWDQVIPKSKLKMTTFVANIFNATDSKFR